MLWCHELSEERIVYVTATRVNLGIFQRQRSSEMRIVFVMASDII